MVEAAAVYCRISRDPEGNMLGVTRQREDCVALAERRGWPVAEVYVDDDVSAYSGKRRPAYRRMLDDLTAGRVDAVIVWHLDRLHRRPAELEEFFGVTDRAGVKALASCSGDVDLSSADGQFHARIMGAVAAKESADKSRRIRRQRDALAAKGEAVVAGRRPFGYERDMVTVREDEAQLIRQLAERYLNGEGPTPLARWLTEQGIPTPSGGDRWTASTVKTMLGGARIAGLRVHRGEVIGDAAWPAIIDLETHERIRARMGDPRRTRHDTRRSRLLSTLVHCGECQQPMSAKRERTLKSGPRAGQLVTAGYYCTRSTGRPEACGRRAIRAEGLEAYVSGLVLEALTTPAVPTGVRSAADEQGIAHLTGQLRDLQARLDELADAFADGAIDRSQLIGGTERLRGRMDQVRKAIRRLDRAGILAELPTDGTAMQAMWEAADLGWRRRVVAAVVERVVIGPGRPGANGLQLDRVAVDWRKFS